MAFLKTAWLAAKGWRSKRALSVGSPVDAGTAKPGDPWPEVTADALDALHEAGVEAVKAYGRRTGKLPK